MKKMIAIMLAVVMLLSLCACGGGKEYDEALLGVYSCYEIEAIGYAMSPDEVWSDTCTIELKQGGKGSMHIDGEDASVKYDIVGESIEITVEGETATGSLVDGIIEVELMGLTMRLAQDGVTPPTGTTEEPVDDPATEVDPGTEPEAPAESSVSLDPVTATLGDFEVTIQAAEEFVNIDGLPGIRFYYDFTNGSDYLTNAWAELNLEVTQDGKVLDTTYAPSEEDVPEYGRDDDDIIPGLTVRCIGEYLFDPEGGIVYLTIEEGYSEDSMSMEFDPAYLQGRPEALELPVISDPDFTAGMSMEGSLEDGYDIVIEGIEFDEGYDGEEVLRVLFTFTNNSEEATSPFMATFLEALQDGIELEESYAYEDAETDENYNVDVAPGESVLCSVCYEIRSDSPVEFMVHDGWDDPEIGTVFDIA